MEKSGASQIPVTEEQLNAYKEEVTALLKMVSWSPDQRTRTTSNTQLDASFLLHVGKALNVGRRRASVLKSAVRISDDRTIPAAPPTWCLMHRKGFCMQAPQRAVRAATAWNCCNRRTTMAVCTRARCPRSDKVDLLGHPAFRGDQLSRTTSNVRGVSTRPSTSISVASPKCASPDPARLCSARSLLRRLPERSGVVKTDLELLKITLLYFERLKEEIQMPGLAEGCGTLHRTTLQAGASDFTVQGFGWPLMHR